MTAGGGFLGAVVGVVAGGVLALVLDPGRERGILLIEAGIVIGVLVGLFVGARHADRSPDDG